MDTAVSALPPQKFREIVFLLLYSSDFGSDHEVVEMVMASLCVSRKNVRLAEERQVLVMAQSARLDALIAAHANAYEFDRIPRVERAVLRLAMYELLEQQLPAAVVFAEAIRITRKFATQEAASFVNAVLAHFHTDLKAQSADHYDKDPLAL
jgi:N utilization substance protein B